VVPEGTATLDRTIVAHDAWDLLAEEAPADPENVQLARFCRAWSREGPGVTAGAATGFESAPVPAKATRRAEDRDTILFQEGEMPGKKKQAFRRALAISWYLGRSSLLLLINNGISYSV
jgi:hypothetical protein